jgi:probable phosphoglycerate mutase
MRTGEPPLSTRIFLVRHGETEWNRIHRFQGRSDVPLNHKGREQARAAATALQDEPFTAIYSSPLIRALETARVIQSFHPSVSLFEEEGFIEMDLGDFDGMDGHEWVAQHADFLEKWKTSPGALKMPSGESLREVQQRALETLERIAQGHPLQSTLLIVSHNFVIRTILCHAMNTHLDEFRNLQQDTAALNLLHKDGDRLWAEYVNDQSHLEEPSESASR